VPNINDAFPSAYIKASDLQGKSVIVTINRIEFEPVGQKREMKPILYFDNKDKGLVLNKTNANKIISITGSSDTEDWAGQSIIIYPTETSFQGDTVECVRVKSAPANGRKAVPVPVADPAPDLTDEDIPF
jgi:hypothetical protein